jgi:hypothetical protein
MRRIATLAAAVFFATTGWAYPQGRPGESATDPIKCWWKTDRTAVRVGERFKLVLTCAVIESTATTVVPAVNQLEPGAIILTPFEAVSGIRREDVVVAPWRYLQYEYEMRLLSEGFFGQDIVIPSLTVTYNLQGPGGDTQGRDQSYLLPPLPMRVLSLVPRAGSDIRDASGQTFETVESRRFQADTAVVIAWIAFAFAAVLAVLAITRATGRFRARDPKAVKPPLPLPTVLRGCLRTLAQVRSEAAQTGWTPELAARALAALRVAGALALGRPLAQEFVGRDARERSGQLSIQTGMLGRKRAVLSAPTTAASIASRLQHAPPARAESRVKLEQIADALHAFGTVTYGRAAHEPDASALNSALDNALAAIKRLRFGSLWPMRTAQAMARSIGALGG